MNRKRVAVLISGRGSNMAALIEAAKDETYPAEIMLVISNRPDAGGLLVARANGIATEVVDHASYGKDRAAFERALQAVLEKHRIDIVCLAGFMRLLTAGFVRQWQHRILNIHPALLPAFKGLDTHRRVIEAGVKMHGATVHFVVPEMDSGPVIAQGAVNIQAGESERALAARVLRVEHQIYPLALKLVAEGRVNTDGDRCLIDDAPLPDTKTLAAGMIIPRCSTENEFLSSGGVIDFGRMATPPTKGGQQKGKAMAARGEAKLVFPQLGGIYESLADWAYPLVRITAGLMLLPHVWPKFMVFGASGVATSLARRGIEPSLAFAYVIMFVELVGGICIAIGFLTRPFALLCLIEMIVIALKAHLPNGWFFTVQGGGGEFPVMWAILFLVILIRGGGPYSVDRALGKEV